MDALTSAAPVDPGSADGSLRLGATGRPAVAPAGVQRRSGMQVDIGTRAAQPAHLSTVADLDAVMTKRRDIRRRQEAEDLAKRQASRRTAKAAQTLHILSVPRMVGLMQAGVLLGSAKALADALGIQPRSLRKKTDSERGVSCEDLRAAADALDARAAAMIQHAAKLRAEAQPA